MWLRRQSFLCQRCASAKSVLDPCLLCSTDGHLAWPLHCHVMALQLARSFTP